MAYGWRVKRVLNWANLSTPLGLAIAATGRAQVSRGSRGMLLAAGYRWGFPVARAFTVGNVVLTRHPRWWLEQRPGLLAHEERHTWQYAACLGLPFLPLYLLAVGYSWLRGGGVGGRNPFERAAGLADGGYA